MMCASAASLSLSANGQETNKNTIKKQGLPHKNVEAWNECEGAIEIGGFRKDGGHADCLLVLTVNVVGRLFDLQTVANSHEFKSKYISSIAVDQTLASLPGVKLFRRADSLTAHPTTQGLSMRAIGANAASKVLVTLDGVPMNDPFGGWIYWNSIHARQLRKISVIKGGAAGAFAVHGLSGQISLNSKPDYMDDFQAEFGIGTGGRLSGFVSASKDMKKSGISGHLSWTQGGGNYLLSPDQRGPIDVKTAFDTLSASATFRHRYNHDGELAFVVRHFKEDRINGYSLGPNSTTASDYIFRLAHEFGDWGLEIIQWYKSRDFQNTFVAARDDRTVERPVLDQYNVPAWGAGGLVRLTADKLYEFGMDWQRSSGEVNEQFRNLGNGFTRERKAGGDQKVIGGYGRLHLSSGDRDKATITVRLDQYNVFNGARTEFNLSDLSSVRDENHKAISGSMVSGGVSGFFGDEFRVTYGANKSWRLPTLNEYYRPFRVGNDITEANGALTPEKLYTAEIGLSYDYDDIQISANFYHAVLKDGVGNVTIAYGPGFYPLGGYVPAGGVLRQRANIDQVITDGIEIEAEYFVYPLTINISYLNANARITEFRANPDLIGKRPVQTPKHNLTLSGRYDFNKAWLSLEGRYMGAMFDDDLNERHLNDAFVVNMAVGYDLNANTKLKLTATNILDSQVISAVSADGLETIAQRRNVMLTIGFNF